MCSAEEDLPAGSMKMQPSAEKLNPSTMEGILCNEDTAVLELIVAVLLRFLVVIAASGSSASQERKPPDH